MADEISLKDVMLKASVTMMAIMVASRFLGYLFHLIFVRSFPQEDYGTFIFVWSMGLFLCGLIPNIPAAMGRYVAFYRGGKDSKGLESTISTGLLLNTALLILALAITSTIYLSGLYSFGIKNHPSFAFMLSAMILTSVSCLFGGILTGHRRPEVSSFFNFLQNLLRISAVVLAALLLASLWGVMVLVAFSFLLSTMLLIIYEHRTYGFGRSFDAGIAKKLIGFGFFSIIHVTSNNMLSWANIFLLQFFLSSAVVAVYNVAWLASTVNLLFFTAVLQIFSPVVTELFGAKKSERISYITSYLIESFFLLFLPIFLAVFIFAREILVLFVTSDYLQAADPLRILSLNAFFFGIAMLFIELINAEGRPELNARNIGFGALLNLALNLLLIPPLGMFGSALATLASSVAILLLSYGHVRGVVRLSYSPLRICKLFASSILTILSISVIKEAVEASVISLVLSSVSLVLIYCLLVVALKSLRQEDVMLASTLMDKFKIPTVLRHGISRLLGYGVYSKTSS
ncbi:MAG: polysaccharide biosynthesis C-terminal domain-containing protein [Candidatus Altiarchaeota archaeon]